jgi:hypothetical protein
MLYYQLAIAPAASHPEYRNLGYGIASIMVTTADGIAEATSRALEHLTLQHWEVVKVRQARLAEQMGEFSHDQRLIALYRRAERSGLSAMLAVPGYAFTDPEADDDAARSGSAAAESSLAA